MLFVLLPPPPCSHPPPPRCGSLAQRQPRLAVVVHFHLIHHIKTDNQKVITVAWHQCLPQEDRVIEHHRREESRLSQGHAVMNVRCRHKRRGSGSRCTETQTGQRARLTTGGGGGRRLRAGRWTKRTLWKEVREADKHRHDFQVIESIHTLSGRRNRTKKREIWLGFRLLCDPLVTVYGCTSERAAIWCSLCLNFYLKNHADVGKVYETVYLLNNTTTQI